MSELLHQLWLYIQAVFGHWAGYATGGGLTAILFVWDKLVGPIPKRVFRWVFLWSFLIAASFTAWRDEYTARPQLRATIDTVSWASNVPLLSTRGTLYSLIATIRNTGAPSAVEAYTLTITTQDGHHIDAERLTIPEFLEVVYPNGLREKVYGKDALWEKTIHQITTGGLERGRLLFFSPGQKPSGVLKYERGFSDVTGKRFSCSRKDDGSGPNTNLDFPGVERRF